MFSRIIEFDNLIGALLSLFLLLIFRMDFFVLREIVLVGVLMIGHLGCGVLRAGTRGASAAHLHVSNTLCAELRVFPLN